MRRHKDHDKEETALVLCMFIIAAIIVIAAVYFELSV